MVLGHVEVADERWWPQVEKSVICGIRPTNTNGTLITASAPEDRKQPPLRRGWKSHR